MLHRLIDFIKNGLWRIRLDKASKPKILIVQQLRIFVLALRGFDEDKCRLRASALTLYSLLSIVPVFAMIFGIAKGFGYESRIEQELLVYFKGHQDAIKKVIEFAHNMLENTKGGLIAGVGVGVLFWSIIKVLSNIEKSFNHIWGIKKGRSVFRKLGDYLSFMLIAPILLIISSSLTAFVTTQVALITEKLNLSAAVTMPIVYLLKFLPFLLIWVMFTFVYYFMPNTKVRFRSALIAGIIAGSMFQFLQWGYITFQVSAAKFSAIYGSFLALPLFLIWMQISWLVVLFGAELSFAHQNVETYEFEPDCRSVSHRNKILLALAITHLVVSKFCRGEKPADATEISHKLDIPIRLIREILFELAESNVLSEIKTDDEKQILYQPARDVEGITLQNVINSLEKSGSSEPHIGQTEYIDKIQNSLNAFEQTLQTSADNILIKNL